MLTSWKAGFLLDGHKGTGKSQVAAHRSTRTQDLMHGVLLRGLEPARHVGTQERCGWLDCLMVFRTGERCSHAPDAGWLVVLEPTPGRYAREIAEIKRSNNGVGGQCAACKSKHTCLQAQVYIQSEFAQQFLEALSLANRHMLEVRRSPWMTFPVNF